MRTFTFIFRRASASLREDSQYEKAMSDKPLTNEKEKQVAELTEELRELRDLYKMVGSLIEEQGPQLQKIAEAEVQVVKGTEKIEVVYKNWWRCSIL
jgi:transposase